MIINLFSNSGAIDGKHVHIQKPTLSGSTCFNYKRTFSAVMMAVADAPYRFIYLDVGAYGWEHDASIFAQSTFGRELENGTQREGMGTYPACLWGTRPSL